MLHARIAARAFNTPLLVEPSKAMAFLSGLGPRILGRQIAAAGMSGGDVMPEMATMPSRRASLLTGDLLEGGGARGEAPYPVVDGIAVIEIAGALIHRGSWIGQSSGQTSYEGIAAQIAAAADNPNVRGIALEIDSFGGEVAGVFDLADRIRATRAVKPVWAFVAEHAFSAGYALASQADRILLPRTGAVGSIGVVVMHADLSGQLDQDGVRVTLIHSGRHKVDGHPYAPLPAEVRDDIQREIDVLRFLFTETVAAGRGNRLNQDAAMATEAATYRGNDAVAAGLADEVIDLAGGFAAFRQLVTRGSTLPLAPDQRRRTTAQILPAPSTLRVPRASLPHPRQEARMANGQTTEDRPEDAVEPATDTEDGERDAADEEPAAAPASPAAGSPLTFAPAEGPAPAETTAQPGNLAALPAELREAAAEIAEIAAQAGRLGIAIDAAKALREGTTPEALRRLVLDRASAAADARDIVAAVPSIARPPTKESPIVAAAKRAAADGRRG